MRRVRTAAMYVVLVLSLLSVSAVRAEPTPIGAPAPEVSGGPWINSEPLTLHELRGRVVLVEFWTYG